VYVGRQGLKMFKYCACNEAMRLPTTRDRTEAILCFLPYFRKGKGNEQNISMLTRKYGFYSVQEAMTLACNRRNRGRALGGTCEARTTVTLNPPWISEQLCTRKIDRCRGDNNRRSCTLINNICYYRGWHKIWMFFCPFSRWTFSCS